MGKYYFVASSSVLATRESNLPFVRQLICSVLLVVKTNCKNVKEKRSHKFPQTPTGSKMLAFQLVEFAALVLTQFSYMLNNVGLFFEVMRFLPMRN